MVTSLSGCQVEGWSLCVARHLLWHRCVVFYPLQVVGHAGVDAIVAWSSAAPPPADDPQQEHCVLILRHQWPAAVALTRVLPALDVSGTEHVFSELHAAVFNALLRADPRHLQPPQHRWGGSVLAPPPPAAHCVHADGPEITLSQRPCWQAGGHGEGRVDNWRRQTQQCDVVISCALHVALVRDDLRHLDQLLRPLVHLRIVFAWQTENRVNALSKGCRHLDVVTVLVHENPVTINNPPQWSNLTTKQLLWRPAETASHMGWYLRPLWETERPCPGGSETPSGSMLVCRSRRHRRVCPCRPATPGRIIIWIIVNIYIQL